jgi:glutamate-1-semialdehyde 2,1-aminomutase
MFYECAQGARIWDKDGNELLDFSLSQGPCILGHSHPELLARIQHAMACGQLFAGQHEQEVLLAEKLQQLVPCAEKVRFSCTGSEADHTALRLARYTTKKPRYIKFEGHYHGWFDNVSFNVNPEHEQLGSRQHPSPTTWGGGIPESVKEDVIPLPWNDLDLVAGVVKARSHEIGAIITEPVMCNQGCIEPQPGFLAGLRELCDAHDIALIFDEIITGFRIDLGGAQSYYGVTPDLAIFGKALASGFPLSAVVGKQRFMQAIEDNRVYHAGTVNSNNVCVAAALATVEILERDERKALNHIIQLGRKLRDGIKEIGQRSPHAVLVQGPGPMFHMGFTQRQEVREYRDTLDYNAGLYAEFCQRMLDHNIRLIGRGLWYVSAAHTEEDVQHALHVVEVVLGEMG